MNNRLAFSHDYDQSTEKEENQEMEELFWERYAVVGTGRMGKGLDKKPRLLAANFQTPEQAAGQCKRFGLQGWGCQVMPVRIVACPPTVEDKASDG